VLRCLESVEGRLDEAVDIGNGGVLTMGELDEAVYAQEWASGFSAAIAGSSDATQLILRIAAQKAPPTDGLEGLTATIEAIPSIRSEKVAVILELVDDAEDRPVVMKRKITDARGPH